MRTKYTIKLRKYAYSFLKKLNKEYGIDKTKYPRMKFTTKEYDEELQADAVFYFTKNHGYIVIHDTGKCVKNKMNIRHELIHWFLYFNGMPAGHDSEEFMKLVIKYDAVIWHEDKVLRFMGKQLAEMAQINDIIKTDYLSLLGDNGTTAHEEVITRLTAAITHTANKLTQETPTTNE